MPRPTASVTVVGAGDFIGGAIGRRFALKGYHVFARRRNGEKLAPLVKEIKTAGGTCSGLSLDARQEDAVADFIRQAECEAARRLLPPGRGSIFSLAPLPTRQ